jgi:hypothetical protein
LSPLGYVVTGIPTRYAVELRVPPNRPATRAGAPPSWQPGDPVISIRRNVAPVAVSDVERAESRAWAEKWMRENADPAWTWRGPPVPTTKPAYTDVRIALDGRIWVKIAQPSVRRPATDRSGLQFGEAVPVWDVFESDGAYVGQVRTPTALTQMIMRGDNVWGALINSDGVPVVKRWRIGWR